MNQSQQTSSAAEPRYNDAEPRAGTSTTPVVVMFILLGFLAFAGGVYLDQHGGGFNARVYPAYSSMAQLKTAQPKGAGGLFEKGKMVFGKTCAPCHQPTGAGVPGTFPPLVGSEWVLAPSPGRAIHIVLDGASGPMEVKGEQFNGAMVPWRDGLTDEDIAAVVTYVRNEWGNKASEVKPDQVKKIREATAPHAGTAWTADDLKKIPESE